MLTFVILRLPLSVSESSVPMSSSSHPCNMSHSNRFSQTHQQNILCFPAPHSTAGHGEKNSAPYLFILWVIDGCAAATVLLVLKSHGALRQRCSHEPLVCEKPMCVIVQQFVCLCVFLDFERWRKKDICVRRQCQLHLNYVNNSP